MFADYVKMAAKIALIAIITAGIIVLLNTVTIPTVNFTAISTYLNIAYSFALNWCPVMNILWPICLSLITLEIGIMTFEIGAIAWRWIFKVNE